MIVFCPTPSLTPFHVQETQGNKDRKDKERKETPVETETSGLRDSRDLPGPTDEMVSGLVYIIQIMEIWKLYINLSFSTLYNKIGRT